MIRPALLACCLATVVLADDEMMKPDEGRFLTDVRQLIFEGRRSGEGYFSADGRSMVFQSEREPGNPFYQIYTLDFGTGDVARVSPGVGKTTCGFLRPGTDDVLFASTHLDPGAADRQKVELEFRASGKTRRYSWDYDEAMDLFVSPKNGGEPRRLTDAPGYDAEGSYSPDGKQIVFCSLRSAFPLEKLSAEDRKRYEVDPASFGEIYLANADGGDVRRLTDSPGYDGGPFFSPDGARVIWRRFDKTGAFADVYTMQTDGTDIRRLTDFGSMSWAPTFHPSGRYAIFTSNKHGFSNFELFVVDANGEREPVRITATDGFDGLPTFGPDGTQLSWTSGRTADGQSQVFLATWDHDAAMKAIDAAPPRGFTSPRPLTRADLSPTTAPAAAAVAHPITAASIKAHVDKLASDEFEGRLTGTEGTRKAGDYLVEHLMAAGLRPAGDDGTYFQPFDFNAGTSVAATGNALTVDDAKQTVDQAFRPLAFSDNGTVSGDVVFAGYGLSTPGKAESGGGEGYDSYAGLDVKGKVVLVLRYVPEGVDAATRQALNRYAGLRYKALLARERGAKGLLVVTGPNSPNAGGLIDVGTDGSNAGSGIVAASVTADVADALLKRAGKTLKEAQDALDKNDPHLPRGFALPGASVGLSCNLERERKSDRNVVAVLPPTEPDAAAEYVLVGAHYDHLGHGENASTSLSAAGERRQVHNGADDNASGTALVLELARAMAADPTDPRPRKRGVIFAFWSGEEIGLLGSGHYAEKPSAAPLDKTVAYLNFDMVGRLRGNKLSFQGVASSTAWRKLIERRNVAVGLSPSLQDDPYLPTDSTSFYPRGVPVLNFFTGSHPEYHRPGDDAETLNYDGLEKIARIAGLILTDVRDAPERPDYVKVQQSQQGGSRDQMRVSIGSIPDYSAEVEGVKLTGVRPGSPADKAGLKGGDVIVSFAGQRVANIYDYTYALDAAKAGQAIEVVVVRDGERVTLSVTPEARK